MLGRHRRPLLGIALAALAVLAVWQLVDTSAAATAADPNSASAVPTAAAAATADAPAAPVVGATTETAQRVTVAGDSRADTHAPPTVPPPDRGVLVVRVRWSDTKAPVAGATVAVGRESGSTWELGERLTTDALGIATFELAADRYRVASITGGDAGSFRVEPGRTTTAAITLPRGYTVAGTVVDEEQRPIAGASIWLSVRWSDRRGDVAARADARGRFRIDGVVDHRLLSATADAHAPSSQREVHAGPGETCEVRLELRRAGADLNGRVVDPAGRPVPAALVLVGAERVEPEGRDETGRSLLAPLPRLLRAGADGRFAVHGLRPGPTPLQARAVGYAPATIELVAVPGGGADQIVPLQVEAIVDGNVRDRRGIAIEGAELRWGARDAFAAAVAHSDANGHFELRGLPAEVLTLTAHKPDLGRARAELAPVPGARTPWDPVLDDLEGVVGRSDSTRLVGVVLDADGQPRSGLQLSIQDAADPQAARALARTASDGTFTARAPAERVRIVVQSAGGWRAFPLLVADDVRPADGPVRLVVPDPARAFGSIAGKVVGPDRQPQRARLTVWHQQARLWREFDVGADGELHIEGVLPGELDLEVRAEGHPWLVLGTRTVVAAQTLQLGTIELAQAGRIDGTFTVPAGIDEASLQFSIYRDHGPEGAVIQARDGRFASGPLAPAEYEVRIQGRGVRMFNRRVVVAVGATSLVHADLEAAAVRTIVVVLPEGGRRPRWIGLQVRDAHGDLAWSGGAGRDGVATEVSLTPGDYVVHANGEGGLTGQAPLHVAGLAPVDTPVRVELRAGD